MTPSDLSKEHLLNPAIMLETFDMAYRYVLDEMYVDESRLPPDDPLRRLNTEGQKELGCRLGTYSLWAREQRKGLTEG